MPGGESEGRLRRAALSRFEEVDYREESETWLQLGELLVHGKGPSALEARELSERALHLDSKSGDALVCLARIASLEDKRTRCSAASPSCCGAVIGAALRVISRGEVVWPLPCKQTGRLESRPVEPLHDVCCQGLTLYLSTTGVADPMLRSVTPRESSVKIKPPVLAT